jgi:hypothetical protein
MNECAFLTAVLTGACDVFLAQRDEESVMEPLSLSLYIRNCCFLRREIEIGIWFAVSGSALGNRALTPISGPAQRRPDHGDEKERRAEHEREADRAREKERGVAAAEEHRAAQVLF